LGEGGVGNALIKGAGRGGKKEAKPGRKKKKENGEGPSRLSFCTVSRRGKRKKKEKGKVQKRKGGLTVGRKVPPSLGKRRKGIDSSEKGVTRQGERPYHHFTTRVDPKRKKGGRLETLPKGEEP